MPDSLPQLTSDLDRARRDLDEFGYCLVADALTAAQVGALRKRLIEQAQAEAETGRGTFDGGAGTPNQRVWNLINKGEVFRELIMHPLVGSVMPHLLGPDFILSSLTANIAGPGGERMYPHRDQGYVSFYTPVALVANIAWMLDDVTAENGGTMLIPRSHLWREPPADPLHDARAIAAQGPAGCALVFDGRLFHGTGPNRTKSKRHVLLSYFARFYLRQQENMFLSLDPDVERSLSDELKARLGYRVRGTLGGVEGPREGVVVRRPERALGDLRPATSRRPSGHDR